MSELWTDLGSLDVERGEYLTASNISDLLRVNRVAFVVANVGEPLRWIATAEGHDWWKRELKPHLAPPEKVEAGLYLEDFPGSYCYVASAWQKEGAQPEVVLAEMWH